MRKTIAVCLALIMGVMPVIARDKVDIVPPGNWRAVELLDKGTSISLRMIYGDKIDGKLLDLDAQGIRLTIDKQERIFPRNDVAEVWQLRMPDRKLNGIIYGMLAGAGAGIIAIAATGDLKDRKNTMAPAFIWAGIGLGALIGGTTDALIKGNRLLYRK